MLNKFQRTTLCNSKYLESVLWVAEIIRLPLFDIFTIEVGVIAGNRQKEDRPKFVAHF